MSDGSFELIYAYTGTNELEELLKAGWEPFWGVRIISNRKARTKMYLRKCNAIPFVAELKESEPITVEIDTDAILELLKQMFAEVFEGMKKSVDEHVTWVEKVVEKVEEKIEENVEVENDERDKRFRKLTRMTRSDLIELAGEIFPDRQPSWWEDQPKEEIAQSIIFKQDNPDLPVKADPLIEDEEDEELIAEVEEVSDEADEAVPPAITKDTTQPSGDNFRIVDDVPAETDTRTLAQKNAIESIKTKHNSGVTVLPGLEDGSVRVLADNIEYRIGPSGNLSTQETGAKTSSLGIGG